MNLIRNNDGTFTFEGVNRTINLTAEEVHHLVTSHAKITLRDRIVSAVHDEDGDSIDLSRYPYTPEEFIDEICTDLEEYIDDDNGIPSDQDIMDKIIDTADFYEMLME